MLKYKYSVSPIGVEPLQKEAPVAERMPIPGHKPIKRMIAAGQFKDAERELESQRHSLIHTLKLRKLDESERDRIEFRLTRNTSMLAELYSKWGKPLKADKWFTKAFKHCDRLDDPIVRERNLRIKAVYFDAPLGRHAIAKQTLETVIARLEELEYVVLKPERMATEIAYTKGLLAYCLLMENPSDQEALDELHAARHCLQGCGKPRYELDILMACIDVKAWASPLVKQLILNRAFLLNSLHVRNVEHFVKISDARTIVPVASFARQMVARVGI